MPVEKNWLKPDLNKKGEVFCDSGNDIEMSLSVIVWTLTGIDSDIEIFKKYII